MNEKTFESGMAMLMQVFPKREFNFKLFWKLLRDLDDKLFEQAVIDICASVEQIFPDTNVIAMIRNKSITMRLRLQQERINANRIAAYQHQAQIAANAKTDFLQKVAQYKAELASMSQDDQIQHKSGIEKLRNKSIFHKKTPYDLILCQYFENLDNNLGNDQVIICD